MTTTRSTLCQIRGSSLANLLNNPRDKDGFVFLDFNPKHFARILDYLRAKRMSTLPGNPPPVPTVPTVGSSEIESFKHLVQHLRLFDEIFPIIKESFAKNNGGIERDVNGTRAGFSVYPTATYDKRVRAETIYTLGTHVYKSGVFRFKLHHYSERNFNVFDVDIGFINQDFRTPNFSRLSDRSSNEIRSPYFFGWSLTKSGVSMGQYRSGRCDWKNDDVIELLLDMDAATLFLNAPDGQQFHIELPKWTKFRLYVRIKQPSSGLRILEVRKES